MGELSLRERKNNEPPKVSQCIGTRAGLELLGPFSDPEPSTACQGSPKEVGCLVLFKLLTLHFKVAFASDISVSIRPPNQEDWQQKLCLALWSTHLLPTLAPQVASSHPRWPAAVGFLVDFWAEFAILGVLGHEKEEIGQLQDNQLIVVSGA